LPPALDATLDLSSARAGVGFPFMSPPLHLRRSIGMSRRWLRYDLAALDPVTDPVTYTLDPREAAGRALATALAVMGGQFVREGWLARAKLVSALRQTPPLDAAALERAPATDVGRWTVLHASEKVSLAVETFNELRSRARPACVRSPICPRASGAGP